MQFKVMRYAEKAYSVNDQVFIIEKVVAALISPAKNGVHVSVSGFFQHLTTVGTPAKASLAMAKTIATVGF